MRTNFITKNIWLYIFALVVTVGCLLIQIIGFESFWGFFGIPTMTPHFADLRTVQAGLESVDGGGVNPQLLNPGDPWGRTMNYPLIWLDIGRVFTIGVESHYVMFCSGIIGSFLLTCAVLLYRFPSVFLLAGICSTSTLLAIERCNNDLAVFVLLYLVAVSALPIALILIFFATIMKIFPIFALHAVFLKRRRWTPAFFIVIAAGLVYLYPQMKAISSGNIAGGDLSYGASSFIEMIGGKTSAEIGIHIVRSVGLFLTFLLTLFLSKKSFLKNYSDSLIKPDTDVFLFLIGASVYVYSFLFASNWDYRLVFLLLCIPFLVKSNHGKSGKYIAGAVLLAMNALHLDVISTASKIFLFSVLLILIWQPLIQLGRQIMLSLKEQSWHETVMIIWNQD